jgi:hypothetical protein
MDAVIQHNNLCNSPPDNVYKFALIILLILKEKYVSAIKLFSGSLNISSKFVNLDLINSLTLIFDFSNPN